MNTTSYSRIETRFDPKPIPTNKFDWDAVFPGYEPSDPIGFGSTEDEAVRDLVDKTETISPRQCLAVRG